MTPQELIQLATVLQAQAVPKLMQYRDRSPALLGPLIAALDNLPSLLENAAEEMAVLDALDAETYRVSRMVWFAQQNTRRAA